MAVLVTAFQGIVATKRKEKQAAPMLKSRFRIAGEVLMIATLAGSAAAQSPRAPINTLNDLEAALLDCWVPPSIEQCRVPACRSRC